MRCIRRLYPGTPAGVKSSGDTNESRTKKKEIKEKRKKNRPMKTKKKHIGIRNFSHKEHGRRDKNGE